MPILGFTLAKDTHPISTRMAHVLNEKLHGLDCGHGAVSIELRCTSILDWAARKAVTGTKGACSLFPYDALFVLTVTTDDKGEAEEGKEDTMEGLPTPGGDGEQPVSSVDLLESPLEKPAEALPAAAKLLAPQKDVVDADAGVESPAEPAAGVESPAEPAAAPQPPEESVAAPAAAVAVDPESEALRAAQAPQAASQEHPPADSLAASAAEQVSDPLMENTDEECSPVRLMSAKWIAKEGDWRTFENLKNVPTENYRDNFPIGTYCIWTCCALSLVSFSPRIQYRLSGPKLHQRCCSEWAGVQVGPVPILDPSRTAAGYRPVRVG